MAIDPYSFYGSGQVDAPTTTYPYGCAKNESSVGNKDGFPLEAAWVKDLQGFVQGLLQTAGLTASGAPDTAVISQYRQAVQIIADSAAEDAVDDVCINTQAIPLEMTWGASSDFVYIDPASGCPLQQNATTGYPAAVPVRQPLTGVSLYANGLILYVKGFSGHSSMPANKPRVQLWSHSAPSSGEPSPTLIADAYDPETLVPDYEDYHYIQPTFAETALNPSMSYFLRIYGESGANSLTGLKVYSALMLLKRTP